MADLEKLGYVNRGGKGSHRNYTHVSGARFTLSGSPGDDAKTYQERDLAKVAAAIKGSK